MHLLHRALEGLESLPPPPSSPGPVSPRASVSPRVMDLQTSHQGHVPELSPVQQVKPGGEDSPHSPAIPASNANFVVICWLYNYACT